MPDLRDADHQDDASPFAYPVFRSIWLASMAANFGSVIQAVGASWLMVSLGAGPQMVALVSTMTLLPIMLFALLAGAVADNFDRRKIMLVSQTFMLVMSAVLAVITWNQSLNPGLLLFLTFMIGCGAAFNVPAWQASVGDMVPRQVLPLAIAYNGMGYNIARSLGPAIGGAIVAAAGAAAAFALNALSYIGPLSAIRRWRPVTAAHAVQPERLGDAMAAGVRYVMLSPNILSVMLRAGLFGLAGSPISALMPLVARDLMGGGPLTFGVLLGGFGAGAVAGALVFRRLRTRWSNEWLIRGACFTMAAGAVICAVSSNLPLSMSALALTGVGWVLALSTFNTSVQFASPRWVLARTLALYQMAAFGGMVSGSWLCGWITAYLDVEAALFIAAAGLIASGLVGLLSPMPDLENIDLDPLGRWTEPQTTMPVSPRMGPVVIEIEYHIEPRDSSQFRRVMSERRRICARDGASGWSLVRDLADPDKWIERYHLATWLDYVRYNHRRTRADDANFEAIKGLHKGEAPRVRRSIEQQTDHGPEIDHASARELADPVTDATRSL